jgi:hypothetical protein
MQYFTLKRLFLNIPSLKAYVQKLPEADAPQSVET